jgi:hypothetical protein
VQNEADLAAKDRPRLKRIDTSERLRIGTNSSGSSPNTKRSRSPSPLMLDRGKPAADSPAKMDRPPSAMSIQELCRVQAQTPTAANFKDTPKRGELSPPSTANADEPEDFIVSSIIPNFLYLGPDPCTAADVQELEDLGIRQILNMALEIDDRLGLADRFDKYHKIPMRDFVEEKGVQGRIDEACSILGGWLSLCRRLFTVGTDDADLKSKPVYVHCRAGKSRSVTIVLACEADSPSSDSKAHPEADLIHR